MFDFQVVADGLAHCDVHVTHAILEVGEQTGVRYEVEFTSIISNSQPDGILVMSSARTNASSFRDGYLCVTRNDFMFHGENGAGSVTETFTQAERWGPEESMTITFS